MKKLGIIFFSFAFVFGLVGCGPKGLEGEVGKENAEIIESAVEEMERYYISEAKYKEGNSDEKSGTYKSGTCEFTLYTDGQSITKVKIEDLEPGKVNASTDFTYAVNSVMELSDFSMSSSTSTKLANAYRKKENAEKNIDGYIVQITKSSLVIAAKTEESLAAAIPVTLDKVEMIGFKCLPPDSIGTIYMQTKFKNNSEYVLKSIQYVYSFDDDKHYLSSYDTLLPGETSTLVDTFGPKSRDLKDAKLVSASFTVLVDGEDVYVDYDAKLKEYTWY